jgi:hypothetical protein
MLAHLDRLFGWTRTSYPNARFEMRFIGEAGVENRQFGATEDGILQAVASAIHHNELGYNIRGGRLRRDSVSPWISGASAG